jgi:hypothetical protein
MGVEEYIKEGLSKGLSKKEIYDILTSKGYSRRDIDKYFSAEKVVQYNVSLVEKIKYLIVNPTKFFEIVKNEPMWISFVSLLVVSIGTSLITVLFFFALSRVSLAFMSFSFMGIISSAIVLIGSFIYAGVSQLIIMMFKGEKGYAETYKVIAYSSIPAILLGIIPFFGFISWIYSIVLMVFGFSNNHNISKGKSVVAAIVPIFVMILFIIGLIILIYFSLSGFY